MAEEIKALWITGGGAFRREFAVGANLVSATAEVTGLGYYEFYCNGAKVSAAALAPSFTEFDIRVEYETIDLTPFLAPGANAVGFLLGDGWWRHGQENRSRQLVAFGEIALRYADGRVETIATDDAWSANHGPLVAGRNESPHQFFDGVTLDLGWLASDWAHVGGRRGWGQAEVTAGPTGTLVPIAIQPIRETETLRAVSVTPTADGSVIVDFGQNFTGWVRLRARGERGDEIEVRHTEVLGDDGRLDFGTLRTARQTDSFVLSGREGGDLVEPKFLHHGFRYAEIAGAVGAVDIDSIEGVVVHTDLPTVGWAKTGDSRIDWLLDALRWTVRSNAMSVMTDVCQRDERRGWLMDGFTGLKAGLLFYDMQAMGRKWLQDMLDNQLPDGSLRGDCAPIWGPNCSIGWQRTLVLLPMTLAQMYGDLETLRYALPAMRRYADFVLAGLVGDRVPAGFSRHPAEWLSIGRGNKEFADTAFAIDVFRQVAEAERLTESGDGRAYDDAAERVATAAHRAWYDKASACYLAGESFGQSANVYALRFGITPPDLREAVFARLVDDFARARGDEPFVTTGIGSTEHLPIVLSEFGRDDLVWRWLQRDSYPSYGFMQRNGATAIWERWERMTYHQMNAHNHTGLAGIGTWLMRSLIGIRVNVGDGPRFDIRPGIALPLASLDAGWQSRWGEVRIAWQPADGGKRLRVSVPNGQSARLFLPGASEPTLLGGGEFETNVGI